MPVRRGDQWGSSTVAAAVEKGEGRKFLSDGGSNVRENGLSIHIRGCGSCGSLMERL